MQNLLSIFSRRLATPIGLVLLALCFGTHMTHAQLPPSGGGGFLVFGRVYLPDGKPAPKARVYIEASTGMTREAICDDSGNYEIRGMTAGRYRVKAINPIAPDQYSNPAESESTRSYANRVQIDVYLRLPLTEPKPNLNPRTIHVDEAAIPKVARKAYEQGLKLQKEKRPQEALVQFNQAIELHPNYFQALTERGDLLMQHNKMAEAEADFAQALKLNGKYAPAWRGIGYCQIQQKKFAAAVTNLENAFALEPNVPLTLLLLGYGNLSLNRYEEAKQCLQAALQLDEKRAARAHVYLGEIFAHEQKFKEAADAVRAYLKAKPDAADAAQLQALEAQWRSKASPK